MKSTPMSTVMTTAAKLRGINYKVLNFARRPENLALLHRTRSHSTPFRGTYWSKYLLDQVADVLDDFQVDVLVMGSNPNDVGDTTSASKYRNLEDQIASGFYGEAYWSPEGIPVPGWSPFNDPKPGWKLLTDALRKVGRSTLGQHTFANYIPWGSQDLADLARQTAPDLLDRVVAFADELFEDVICVLKPRLVLIPKSLTANPEVGNRTRLGTHRKTAKQVAVEYGTADGGRRLNLEIGDLRVGAVHTRVIHIAHPSSWRIPVASRSEVRARIAEVILDSR